MCVYAHIIYQSIKWWRHDYIKFHIWQNVDSTNVRAPIDLKVEKENSKKSRKVFETKYLDVYSNVPVCYDHALFEWVVVG